METSLGGVYGEIRIDQGDLDQEIERTRVALGKVAEATVQYATSTGLIVTGASMAANAQQQLAMAADASAQASVKAAMAQEAQETSLQRLTSTGRTFSTEVGEATVALARLKNEFVSTEAAGANWGNMIDNAGKKAGGASTMFRQNLGFSILFVSQAVEDFSYGIKTSFAQATRNILNNIPLIVMAMGGSAGLAGGISIASVAVSQLIDHWDVLLEKIGMRLPAPDLTGLDELQKKLKEVNDETSDLLRNVKLSYTEYARLRTLQVEKPELEAKIEREKNVKAIHDIEGKEESDIGKGVKDAVKEFGGGTKAIDRLATAIDKTANGAFSFDNTTGKVLTRKEEAERMLGAAGAGDRGARDKIEAALRGANGLGDPLLMAMIENEPGIKENTKKVLDQITANKKKADSAFDRELEKADKEYDKFIDDAAKHINKGPAVTAKLLNPNAKKFTDSDIEGMLTKQGATPEEAKRNAPAVLKSMREQMTKTISDFAKENGLSFGDARQEIGQQREEKEAAETRRLRAGLIKQTERRLPGAEKATEDNLVRGVLSGMSEAQAQAFAKEQLKTALKSQGLDDKSADTAAGVMASEASGKLQEKMANDSLNPPERRNSETINLRGFQSKVQAGVSGEVDSAKQRLKALEGILANSRKTNDLLAGGIGSTLG